MRVSSSSHAIRVRGTTHMIWGGVVAIRTVSDLAARLRERRSELGMRQEDLARIIGTNRRWVADFESGRSSPRLDLALKAVEAMGLSVNVVEDQRSVEILNQVLGPGASRDERFGVSLDEPAPWTNRG
ncbi:MAG: helix-turn-helix transcriptional regulator [Galactobacter sp.]